MQTDSRSKARVAALLAAAAMVPGALLAATASGAPPEGDVTEPTWVRDRVATFWADWEAPPASDARYSMFVVGPQDPAHPQEPEHQEADGSTGPAHDHVLPNIPYGRRATCHVWAVFASETAPPGSVLVRDSGLAYAVDLGDGLRPLTAYSTVTSGLAAGLLTLADPGFPDFTCWTHRR